MNAESRTKFARQRSRDLFLSWSLLVYTLFLLAFQPSSGGLDAIRIPSFTLLLLFLLQVIFPRFRFSRGANLLAVLVIVGLGFLTSSAIFQP